MLWFHVLFKNLHSEIAFLNGSSKGSNYQWRKTNTFNIPPWPSQWWKHSGAPSVTFWALGERRLSALIFRSIMLSPSLGIVNVNHTDLFKNSCIFGNNQKVFCEMLEVMGFSLPLERLKDCFLQDVFKRIADFNSQHPIWLPLTLSSRILAT